MLFSLHEQTTPAAAAYIFDVEGGIVPRISPDEGLNQEFDAILSCDTGSTIASDPGSDLYDRWDGALRDGKAPFVLEALSKVMRRHEQQVLRGAGVAEAATIAARRLRQDRRAVAFVSRLTPGTLRQELGEGIRGALFEQLVQGNESLLRSVRKAQLFLDNPERQTVFVSPNEWAVKEIQRRTRMQTLTVQLGTVAASTLEAYSPSPLAAHLSTV